jgi:2-oxoglutarate/2-oxoacid ferredoxin oxidoreductase subunit beta
MRDKSTWCPACGDFAVLKSMEEACANLGIRPKDIVLVSGIGCSGKITSYFYSYGFHVFHGRTLPIATGIKLANRNLTVLAAGGDGDGYGIGLNHLLHTARRNVDITYIVMDNQCYGNTKGQTSPTSLMDYKSDSTPFGAVEEPIHPLALAIISGATYVAQGFSGDVRQLTRLIQKGIEHKGFSLVNVNSPCVTFNKFNTYDWFRQRMLNLDQSSHDSRNKLEALKVTMDDSKTFSGLLYEVERETFEDKLPGFLRDRPLAFDDLSRSIPKVEAMLEQFL